MGSRNLERCLEGRLKSAWRASLTVRNGTLVACIVNENSPPASPWRVGGEAGTDNNWDESGNQGSRIRESGDRNRESGKYKKVLKAILMN